MKQSEQLIQEALHRLPDHIQESIKNTPWLDGLQKISERRHLHVDKLEEVRLETFLMILGLIDDVEYIGRIHTILNISGEELDTFIEEVNNEVFSPLREAINKKQGDPEEESLDHKSTLTAFEKRLNQKVHTKVKTTDHSIGKKEEVKPYTDPYREPLD